MSNQLREEHIRQFILESRRVECGLEPVNLSNLVKEVLGYTEDTALCAILADLPVVPIKEFLKVLLEYIEQTYGHIFDLKGVVSQVEAEQVLFLCKRYLPYLEQLQKSIKEMLDSKINYSTITKSVYPQFEEIFKTLDEESFRLSDNGAWYVEAFGSIVFDMGHANHLAGEVVFGVIIGGPAWEIQLPDWIGRCRDIVKRLEPEIQKLS